MNSDVELYIKQNTSWSKLPSNVRQNLANSQKEYEKAVLSFSIKNQLRYKGNLVRQVCKDEPRYYEEVLNYSKENLLLYPYHLSDVIVKGLRITPFQYYTKVLETIMDSEKSYDSLPNFTAADCLRLLGIGRNEYIDLMNQCRSGRKLFRRKSVKDLLPSMPIDIQIEPWWIVEVGFVTEMDMKLVSQAEKFLIDKLIDDGKQRAGDLDYNLVHSLYKKGLIYLEVPIESTDHMVVPPLEGFVMNRVLGDNFETLLYKIFVSIDEHTSVGELAGVLQIELQAVKQAVSLYCRLGFARKKILEREEWHPTWNPANVKTILSPTNDMIPSFSKVYSDLGSPLEDDVETSSSRPKRIAFLFDSTLTAFLMMGNLSPGLKSHAVTMFEVGKLTDETMDSFLSELEKVSTARDDSEGEARRYFEHALVLRSTVLALRHKGLDLVRCESLHSLEKETCFRLLNKNYSLLVSMAPLSAEVLPITSSSLPHLGPASAQVHSPWFKLFLYHITGSGPPSLLLSRGTRLNKLPSMFKGCDKVLITSWGHDSTVIPSSNAIFVLNDTLCYSPVLAQVHGLNKGADTQLVPFPFHTDPEKENGTGAWKCHPGIVKLASELDLIHTCGYITMVHVKSQKVEGAPHVPLPQHPRPSQDSLTLFLKPHHDVQVLDTPATPLCVEAWIHTMSSGSGDMNIKSYTTSPLKDDSEDPINGINSIECAEILRQELDNLNIPSAHSSPSRDGESKEEEEVVPCSLGVRVDLSERRKSTCSPINLNDWSLLDVSFGMPLFDADVNKVICDNVVESLIQPSSLEQLIISNIALTNRLNKFIEQVQDWNMEGIGELSSYSNNNMWPLTNLMFSKGHLLPWDGL